MTRKRTRNSIMPVSPSLGATALVMNLPVGQILVGNRYVTGSFTYTSALPSMKSNGAHHSGAEVCLPEA